MASSSYIYTENGVDVMKLSEYNDLAKALGYQQETIEKEDEIFINSWSRITKTRI